MDIRGIETRGIGCGDIDRNWAVISKKIAEVLENHSHGELSVDDIYKLLKRKEMQLWIAHEPSGALLGVIITEVVKYPQLTACRIVVLVGRDIKLWRRSMWDLLSAWARSIGCVRMEALARQGIARMFQEFGFKDTYSLVVAELERVQLH